MYPTKARGTKPCWSGAANFLDYPFIVSSLVLQSCTAAVAYTHQASCCRGILAVCRRNTCMGLCPAGWDAYEQDNAFFTDIGYQKSAKTTNLISFSLICKIDLSTKDNLFLIVCHQRCHISINKQWFSLKVFLSILYDNTFCT